jgi:ATP-dependent Clp protease ATP-binding subunit ClpC
MTEVPLSSHHSNQSKTEGEIRSGRAVDTSPILIQNKLRDDSEGASGGDDSNRSSKATGLIVRPTALTRYCRDVTEDVHEGRLDPVTNREAELERLVEVLSKRTKRNAILIGEAGVGKTAIVEGLAQRIVDGDVLPPLLSKRVMALDVAALAAGTEYRGEFEERIIAIVEEIAHDKNVILFIDEFHTIVTLGAGSGELNAGNILKPPLARGEIQCIGATTLKEYRKGVERDSALARRFEPILINAPTVEQAIPILEGLRPRYEEHHNVNYSPEAMVAAVVLSDRYISRGQLPDKAIDVMDEAGSAKAKPTAAHARADIAGFPNSSLRRTARVTVTAGDIAAIVSKMSGVPVSNLTSTEARRLLDLETTLKKIIIGQNHACEQVAKAEIRGRAGLQEGRPVSFLFAGPTGVGKTELVKTLTECVFGDDKALIQLDMSEYMEPHNVSRLIAAPPGHIGYEEGGQLTERVRRRPNAIILLDEFEKAHPNVCKLLLQALEEGRLTDGQSRVVDFKNTITVMTSNIGAEMESGGSSGFGFSAIVEDRAPTSVGTQGARRERYVDAVKNFFPPEFVNRIGCIVPFDKLSRADQAQILDLQLQELAANLFASKGITLMVPPDARAVLLEEGFSESYGVRPLRRAIEHLLTDRIAEVLLGLEKTEGLVFTATPTGYSLTLAVEEGR